MVTRWLLALTLSLQVTFAIGAERTDYRDWDKNPEKRQQVINRWDDQFEGVKKQIALTKNYANGPMSAVVERINGEDKVRTQIRDSGYDPDTGKKIRIEANVTQTANKAKVASTLVDRLKKASDYAKKAGKASIPSFVGGAAVQALVDGVGWLIDEGGKVKRKPTEDETDLSNYQFVYVNSVGSFKSAQTACTAYTNKYPQPNPNNVKTGFVDSNLNCNVWNDYQKEYAKFQIYKRNNPAYNPASPAPQNVEVTQEQLQKALEDALKSNNPALAAAIAQAIKDAYTFEGKLASVGDEQANGLAVNASDTARDAVNKAAKNTGTEPTSSGKPGYYKITDGEKTVEGYVYPSDTTSTGTTDSTTTTNPDGSTTTTGTMAQEWPAFCDWAGVVCDFIDWVKEDEEIPEDEPEKIDESIFDRKFDISFDMGGSCPPNPTWNFDFVGQHWSKEINITSICDFFRYLGYAIVFASNMTALWIVYGAVTVREQG